ncbi:hypothetical protein VTN77DRAFT_11 [Rasamsonia byssochlamydoides]|uniref:uncharacterized protein n=1 Tax=Rasamsonia byssochlamydoides TaxID=89139 RepID=UPI00374388DE
MPDKRKTPSSEHDDSSPYAKRSRSQALYADAGDGDDSNDDDEQELAPALNFARQRPRSDPVYGQKSAFPGLDDPNAADELFYGPAEDGLEYLRMVRSEANSLPTLFVAPKTTPEVTISKEATGCADAAADEEDLQRAEHESRGYYYDGVYVARSSTPSEEIDEEGEEEAAAAEEDAQSSYYNLLRHRFLLLRSTLRCSPPASAIAALDDSHPISLPYSLKPARSEWRRLLLTTDPQMVQLACMDMKSVFGVMKIMARLLSESVKTGDAMRIRRIGAWAWGLLGRCRDVGQLASEEVSELRDLGKRAVKILSKLREEERAKAIGGDDIHRHGHHPYRQGEGADSEEDRAVVETGVKAEAVSEQPVDKVALEVDQTTTADRSEATQVSAAAESTAPAAAAAAAATNTTSEPENADLEAAKARLQARLREASQTTEESREKLTSFSIVDEEEEEKEHEKSNLDLDDAAKETRAMLDMIITIVGEFYGQRDLLDARDVW